VKEHQKNKKKGHLVTKNHLDFVTYRKISPSDLSFKSITCLDTPRPTLKGVLRAGGGDSCFWNVGLDTEWYRSGDKNIVITYQVWIHELNCGYLIDVKKGWRLSAEQLIELLHTWIGFNNDKKHFLNIIMHFSRAEFFALYELEASVVNHFRSVRYIQKTFTSIRHDEYNFYDKSRNKKCVNVRFCDTSLLSGKAPLFALGNTIDYGKIEIGSYITRMNELYVDDPDLYMRYSMVDAYITADYFVRMEETLNQVFNIQKTPCTASQIGEIYFKQGLDVKPFLGYESLKMKYFDRSKMQMKSFNKSELPLHVRDGKQCYYGGRNETYKYGVFREKWIDYDIKSAYASIMLTMQDIDWSSYKQIEDATTIQFNDVGYATVAFKFKDSVKYPMFPIKNLSYGLIYVQEGETTVTLPELYTAMQNNMLEYFEIKQSIRFKKLNKFSIPETIAKLTLERNKYESGTLENLLYKLIINSLYGKLTQGMNLGSVIDLLKSFESGEIQREEMEEGGIFNPFLAAYITGGCRAIVSEYMNDFDKRDISVINTTTDGFMIDTLLSEQDLKGKHLPFTSAISTIRKKWIAYDNVLEVKHVSSDESMNIAVRTRNYWMHDVDKMEDIKKIKELMVARGGVQTDRKKGLKNAIETLTKMFLKADFDSKYVQTHLTSLNEYMLGNKDLMNHEREVSKNWDYDFKRKPVDAYDTQVVHEGEEYTKLCFNTLPFKNIKSFMTIRESYDKFMRYQTNINKITTKKELDEFTAYSSASQLIDSQIHNLEVAIRNKVVQALLLDGFGAAEICKMLDIATRTAQKVKDGKITKRMIAGEIEMKKVDDENYENLKPILNKYLNKITNGVIRTKVVDRIREKPVFNEMAKDVNYFEALAKIEI